MNALLQLVTIMATLNLQANDAVERVPTDERFNYDRWRAVTRMPPAADEFLITARTEGDFRTPEPYQLARWRASDGQLEWLMKIPDGVPNQTTASYACDFVFSPDGERFAGWYTVNNADGRPWLEYGVAVYDKAGLFTSKLRSVNELPRAVAWVGNDRLIYTSHNDWQAIVGQLDPTVADGGRKLGVYHGHEEGQELRHKNPANGAIRRIAVSPDQRLAATGDSGGAVIVWDIDTLKTVRVVRPAPPRRTDRRTGIGQYDLITDLAFLPDGKHLAFSTQGGHLEVYDLATGKMVAGHAEVGKPGGYPPIEFNEFEGPHVWHFDVSPDGRRIAFVASEGGPVNAPDEYGYLKTYVCRVFDVAENRVVASLPLTAAFDIGRTLDEQARVTQVRPFFIEGGRRVLLIGSFPVAVKWDYQLPVKP